MKSEKKPTETDAGMKHKHLPDITGSLNTNILLGRQNYMALRVGVFLNS